MLVPLMAAKKGLRKAGKAAKRRKVTARGAARKPERRSREMMAKGAVHKS